MNCPKSKEAFCKSQTALPFPYNLNIKKVNLNVLVVVYMYSVVNTKSILVETWEPLAYSLPGTTRQAC